MSSPGQDGVPAEPTVRTAPTAPASTTPDVAPGTRWWSSIPRHLGRARTSTVVLSVVFLGLFTLWLYVRPESPRTSPAPDDAAVVEEPLAPTTTPPAEPEPEPTTPAPTTPAPTTAGPEETEPPATTPRSPEPTTTPEQTIPPGTVPLEPDGEPAPTTSPPPAG